MERRPLTESRIIHHTQKELSKDPVITELIASVNILMKSVAKIQINNRDKSRSTQPPRPKSQSRSHSFRQSV